MISYAQNFEDVILERVFSGVVNGFYVDVGACFPDICSVTLHFYNKGWSGINIEPNPAIFQLLSSQRVRDINLNCAAGSRAGALKFFEFPDEPGSSTCDAREAQVHLREARPVNEIQVPVRTVENILCEYAEARDIHFLKIDVEGFEREVLLGCALNKFRPWVVVVEAMRPWKQISTHEHWESLLLDFKYQFVYEDGLNRFYLAEEKCELSGRFRFPPNVFDGFTLATQREAEEKHNQISAALAAERQASTEVKSTLTVERERAQWLENEWNAAKARIETLAAQVALADDSNTRLKAELDAQQQANTEVTSALTVERERAQWLENEWNAAKAKIEELNDCAHRWWTVADDLNRQLQTVYASRSWRISHPLRVIVHAFHRSKQSIQAVVKALLARMIRFALARPALKARALAWVRKHPALEIWLRRFFGQTSRAHTAPVLQPLSPDPQARKLIATEQTVTPDTSLRELLASRVSVWIQ